MNSQLLIAYRFISTSQTNKWHTNVIRGLLVWVMEKTKVISKSQLSEMQMMNTRVSLMISMMLWEASSGIKGQKKDQQMVTMVYNFTANDSAVWWFGCDNTMCSCTINITPAHYTLADRKVRRYKSFFFQFMTCMPVWKLLSEVTVVEI